MEFTEEHEEMLKNHGRRIGDLETSKVECDNKHDIHLKDMRRRDDAMNHLSDTNLELAKVMSNVSVTVANMNETIKDVVAEMKGDRPIIDFWKSGRSAYEWIKLVAPPVAFFALCVIVVAFVMKYI